MIKANIQKIKLISIIFLCIFAFSACGYKPSTYYAKQELAKKVFVNLHIDLKDPRNAVLIKDDINQILIQNLNSTLVYRKENAEIIMNVKIESVKMQELQYDKDGYNKLYRALVEVKVDYTNVLTKEKKSFTLEGENNFSVDDGDTITDTKRFEAIKEASSDALKQMVSKLAVISY